MFTKILAISISGAVVATSTLQAAAGGYPVECYERHRTPPVYDTVHENVQLHPGYVDVQVSPPVYGHSTREVLVRPGRIEHVRNPAVYSYETERVLLEPARKVKRRASAHYETRYKTVKVSGGYSWEWRVINGRRVLCKIKHKARYKQVAYQVRVSSDRYVYETVPARYGYKKRKTLVQAESTEPYVLAPEYETVHEEVMLQPKQVRKTYVAPSYTTRRRTVMVSPGRDDWNRVAIPRHCRG